MTSTHPDFHDMTRREIEDYIVELASIDESFRDQLLRDPMEALRTAGLPIRDGVSIRVIEQSETNYTILLPAKPKTGNDLSDEDLEGVSGGVGGHFNRLTQDSVWP